MSDSLRTHGLYSPWNSPGQNNGMGSLSFLQGVFLTQGLNPGLPHCRQILYQLSHKGSPRILEWVAYPFSSRSSWPRNQTRVSCIAGRFFTSWATREAPLSCLKKESMNERMKRSSAISQMFQAERLQLREDWWFPMVTQEIMAEFTPQSVQSINLSPIPPVRLSQPSFLS